MFISLATWEASTSLTISVLPYGFFDIRENKPAEVFSEANHFLGGLSTAVMTNVSVAPDELRAVVSPRNVTSAQESPQVVYGASRRTVCDLVQQGRAGFHRAGAAGAAGAAQLRYPEQRSTACLLYVNAGLYTVASLKTWRYSRLTE